jgi:hypothetical protein
MGSHEITLEEGKHISQSELATFELICIELIFITFRVQIFRGHFPNANSTLRRNENQTQSRTHTKSQSHFQISINRLIM